MASKNATSGTDICDELDLIADELDKMKVKFDNGISGTAIRSEAAAGRKLIKQIAGLMTEVATLVDAKNARLKTLAGQRKQARQAVVGKFGDDSAQYASVGGVRVSERKKAGPKGNTPKPG